MMQDYFNKKNPAISQNSIQLHKPSALFHKQKATP